MIQFFLNQWLLHAFILKCIADLSSKHSATICIPSAYCWKRLPIINRTNMTVSRIHQRVERLLATAGRKKKGRGLSNNICRLVLVVGCWENNMTNSTSPTSPCATINRPSQIRNVFFLRHSNAKMTIDKMSRAQAHSVGENKKSCSIICTPAGTSVRRSFTIGRYSPLI